MPYARRVAWAVVALLAAYAAFTAYGAITEADRVTGCFDRIGVRDTNRLSHCLNDKVK